MPMVVPFIPLIAAAAGPLLAKAFGPGQPSGPGGGGGGGAADVTKPKTLFQPEQIKQAQDRYTQAGTAKWNQILANMGAGGGTTGGPDVATQIGSQAKTLGSALGKLTSESGYGSDPMANLDAILKGVEGGIGPKYSVY
jgi:hypothetical protein